MVKYLLKFCSSLKIKNFFSLLFNYYFFKKNFDNILNFPQFCLFFLTVDHKDLNKIKKFIYLKLRQLCFLILTKKNFFFKKKTKYFFIIQVYFSLLIHFLNLLFKKIFCFIPYFFHLQKINDFLNIKIHSKFSIYFLRFDVCCGLSVLIKSTFKFLKKFINDKNFINFFFKLISIFLSKKIHFNIILQLRVFFSSLYFSQFDYFLFFHLKYNILKSKKKYTKKLLVYIKNSLNQNNTRFFVVVFAKNRNLLKYKVYFPFINFKRSGNTFFFMFSGLYSVFIFLKKQIFLFVKYIFKISKTIFSYYWYFLGLILKNYNFSKKKCIKIFVPLKLLKLCFANFGLLNILYKPQFYSFLLPYINKNLVYWYITLFYSFLFYYRNCLNFRKFILSFYYICKWSLFLTLAKKHKKSLKYIFKKYILNFYDFFTINFDKILFKYNMRPIYKNPSTKPYYVYCYFL